MKIERTMNRFYRRQMSALPDADRPRARKPSAGNLTASAFPAACRGVSERISNVSSLQIEDSPQSGTKLSDFYTIEGPPLAAGSFNPAVRRGLSRWENAFGAAVTAGWLLELLLPERWFLVGRIASVFRIGF
jgi:hypothetical protein